MKLASLFDGSGGFPLAGMLCGITPVWASEIEPFPIRVTTKRFPMMKHYGDVSKINGAEVEPVDIITFGSPCQDMSVAGKRAGLDGARSGLFFQATRIMKEMRAATNGKYPRWAVWENVPGAFSSNKGEDFRAVLEELISVAQSEREQRTTAIPIPEWGWDTAGCIVGDGYSLAWRQLDAQYWGVPQRRKRIFLVTDFRGERAGGVLFKSEGLSGYSAEMFSAWQRDTADIERCTRNSGGGIVFEAHMADARYKQLDDVCETVCARYGTGGGNTAVVVESICLNDQGGESINVEQNKSPTLRSEAHGNMPCVIEPKTMKIRSGCDGGAKAH